MKRLFSTSTGEHFACNVVKIKEDMLVILLIMLITNMILTDAASECYDEECHCNTRGIYEVFCKGTYMDVPQHLDENIENLTMYNNQLQKVTKKSFVKYSSLRVLNLTLSGMVMQKDVLNLTPLKKLKILDLSRNAGLKALPSLPEGLEELYLNGDTSLRDCIVDSRVFSGQTSLKLLSLKNIELVNFPVLTNVGHTLEVLDLRENNIKTFSVDDLARLCMLKKLYLETENLFKTEMSKSQCFLVQKWVQQNGIEISNNFMCSETEFTPYTTFDKATLQTREECLDKAATAPYMTFLRKYGLYLTVGLLVIGLCSVLLIIHCRSQRKLRKLRKESFCVPDRSDEEHSVPSHTLV